MMRVTGLGRKRAFRGREIAHGASADEPHWAEVDRDRDDPTYRGSRVKLAAASPHMVVWPVAQRSRVTGGTERLALHTAARELGMVCRS